MAVLLDVIKDGIALSHYLSSNCKNSFYTPTGDNIHQIDIDLLGEKIIAHLRENTPIKVVEIDENDDFPHNSNVYGFLTIKGDTAIIVVNKKSNDCWKRFTKCKELLQLYIDCESATKNDYTPSDILVQITMLTNIQTALFNNMSLKVDDINMQFPDAVVTELQAIVMAADLIFPDIDMQTTDASVAKVNSGKKKVYDIALSYKMPEFVVKTYIDWFYEHSTELRLGTTSIPAADARRKADGL